jgi:DNA polymerase-3 subunit gamma/tau
VPGRLSAAAIREVWPEIITAVGRQSKKVAALASGATVRDLDGQTVVLTFRFPAHAKMVAAEPDLIADALYEALGDRWQIRCEVAGESGGAYSSPPPPSPARAATAQTAPSRSASSAAPARQRERSTPAVARPSAASGDDDWPEPARPGGDGAEPAEAGGGDRPQPATSGDDWPEPAKPGGLAAAPADRQNKDGHGGTAAVGAFNDADTAGRDRQVSGESVAGGSTRPGTSGNTEAGGHPTPADGSVPKPDLATDHSNGTNRANPGASGRNLGRSVNNSDRGVGEGNAGRGASSDNSGRGVGEGNADRGASANNSDRGVGEGNAGRGASSDNSGRGLGEGNADRGASANNSDRGAGPGRGGIAAARAAAAGGRSGGAARPEAAKPDTPRTGTDSWSDESSAEEVPYDPDHDGPVRPGTTTFEGFDPGDEPLDDVIDEKVARQSSEQQAMQLLQDAFGAEKIGES